MVDFDLKTFSENRLICKVRLDSPNNKALEDRRRGVNKKEPKSRPLPPKCRARCWWDFKCYLSPHANKRNLRVDKVLMDSMDISALN